jgi:AcrR family transcriptional regulator
MTRRAQAVDATRRRIVEATVAAHRDLGIQATSWEEIARRAGVGVGTVYRHFRSLDELLPACGELVTTTLALPTGDDLPALFDGARSTRARVERLVGEVFAIYERGAAFIENVRRERKELPQLERWHREITTVLDTLTRTALAPIETDEEAIDVTRALVDLTTWKAFRDQGLSPERTADTVAGLIECSLRSRRRLGSVDRTSGARDDIPARNDGE